ncbi:MAG: hypothetical protein P8125_00410 [Gemmatimonadota bacterium]|jgi:hypothetical protein
MPKPEHSHEVRLRMAIERALELPGEEREQFLRWLRTADPALAAHVLVALTERGSGDADVPEV